MESLFECPLRILYEDPYLIACEKAPGVPAQPDPSGDQDMLSMVRAYQEKKQDRYPVEVVHRLDRATGGVLLFAKGKTMAAKISQLFANHGIEKEYLTVVEGSFDEAEGSMTDYLLHDVRRNVGRVATSDVKGAKKAVLHYRVLAEKEGRTLCLVRLETGRTHQIRIQFSNRNHPLLGDGKYGSSIKGPLALWATSMTFVHPMHRKEVIKLQSKPNNHPFFVPFED